MDHADPAKYGHESYQAIEFRNCQLKHPRSQERWEVTLRHDAGKAPSNEVGESRSLKETLKDCAARNIRTTEDAKRAWIRIAVARAEVVRQEI